MSDWLPIDTAPKDGTSVLVFNGNYVGEAYYSEDASIWDEEDAPRWMIFNCEDYYYSIAVKPAPTHWMPLPEPPK